MNGTGSLVRRNKNNFLLTPWNHDPNQILAHELTPEKKIRTTTRYSSSRSLRTEWSWPLQPREVAEGVGCTRSRSWGYPVEGVPVLMCLWAEKGACPSRRTNETAPLATVLRARGFRGRPAESKAGAIHHSSPGAQAATAGPVSSSSGSQSRSRQSDFRQRETGQRSLPAAPRMLARTRR